MPRSELTVPINWRRWQNSELYVEDYGLRLDEVGEPLRESVMAVLRTSMSAHGYELSRDVMKLNRFLGDIVGGSAVLGEWSKAVPGRRASGAEADAVVLGRMSRSATRSRIR